MTDCYNFPSLYPRRSFRRSLFFGYTNIAVVTPGAYVPQVQFRPGSGQNVINVEGQCRETDPVCRDALNAPFIKLQKFIFVALERGNERCPRKSTVAVSNANPQLEIMDVIFETRKRVFHQDLQTQKRLLTTQDKAELSNHP